MQAQKLEVVETMKEFYKAIAVRLGEAAALEDSLKMSSKKLYLWSSEMTSKITRTTLPER